MRFINEPLARLANKEDGCAERFYEASILASMVYVDLNPVRAGIAEDLKDSDYTSIQQRLAHDSNHQEITAVNESHGASPFAQITLKTYVDLVRWTAEEQSYMRRSIGNQVHRSLKHHHPTRDGWFRDKLPSPHRWQRAMGSNDALHQYAKAIGQCWIKRQTATSK
jgi:hypothetical protein